ncbi:Cai-1 autoinducer sensor kinase/phosphatase cqss [Plakobranchus ocellatus]|uniref:Cai-1 autoinducer sensor kinase/phosphatase cqss n=1 Tax=Plakobranchus ocellatus TaxID=259542 RepID=A0AAV3ZQE4_9GAST|nr:Cai-1 autoinducer sensor kinase/phosphatase cqss [Plakobranchus ocellatus]
MYEHYKIKTKITISYLTFYNIFKRMNISLAHLGHEECEIYEMHKKTASVSPKKFTKTRMEYEKDSESIHLNDEVFTSADLQKVVMLPQMECFKGRYSQ